MRASDISIPLTFLEPLNFDIAIMWFGFDESKLITDAMGISMHNHTLWRQPGNGGWCHVLGDNVRCCIM